MAETCFSPTGSSCSWLAWSPPFDGAADRDSRIEVSPVLISSRRRPGFLSRFLGHQGVDHVQERGHVLFAQLVEGGQAGAQVVLDGMQRRAGDVLDEQGVGGGVDGLADAY